MLIEVGRAKLSANRNFDEVKAFRANLTVSEYLEMGFVGEYPSNDKRIKDFTFEDFHDIVTVRIPIVKTEKPKTEAVEPKAETKKTRKGKTND